MKIDKNKKCLLRYKIISHVVLFLSFFIVLIKERISPRILTFLNPGIHNGGLLTHSKLEISKLFKDKGTSLFLRKLNNHAFNTLKEKDLPLIVKPDKGLQGIGVKLIEDMGELKQIIKNSGSNFVIQEYCPFQIELDLSFFRKSNSFEIVGIAKKSPNSKVIRTKGEVIYKDITKEIVTRKLKEKLDRVIPKGLDYGRLDIMIKNLESFKIGKNFKIIEFNPNIGAMYLHGYDSNISFKKRVKIFYSQISNAFKIAKLSKKRKYPPYNKLFLDGMNFLKDVINVKHFERTHSKT